MEDKDLEYIEYLIKKADVEKDIGMVVHWLPHVKVLVEEVKRLREYERRWKKRWQTWDRSPLADSSASS